MEDLKNIQNAWEMYTSGLHIIKNSLKLNFETFKKLANSEILIQNVLKSGNI